MINSSRWFLVSVLILFAGAGCSRQARMQRHLTRANQDFQAGQYEKAEIEYQRVLQLVQYQPVAVRQLGMIYYENGRLPQAMVFLQKALELEPENQDVHLRLGQTYLGLQQHKEATEQANRLLEKHPGHEEALLMLAEMPVRSKEFQDAEQKIENLRQKDKDVASYHVALSTLFFRQAELEKAEAEIKKALELDPKSSAAQVALGNLKWARNDLDAADLAFKTAADSTPLRSPSRLKYADFKLKTGQVEEARKMLEELSHKVPDYLPAWTYLMHVAFAQRRLDECGALARKILSRDSLNYDGLLMTGNMHLVANDAKAAVADFERMTSTYDRVPRVRYQLALAYLMNGDTGKALKSLDQALQLQPNHPEAMLLQAELNLRRGSVSPAIASLSELIKQQPQIMKAHLLLANAYLTQKNTEDALAVYRRMAVLFPKSPDVPLYMGIVLAQQNQPGPARAAFEKAIELAPDYLPAIEQLVGLDIGENKFTAAIDRVKQLEAKDPKSPQPWLLYAKIHAARHEDTQTEADLLKAIDLDPDSRGAYLLLAQMYVTTHKEQQALDRLGKLLARTNDVAALMQSGMIHQQMKQPELARDAYEKLLTVNPKFGQALNNLAYLYSEELSDLPKAVGFAKRARQLQPGDPSTADTLGWVLFKQGDYPRAVALLEESAVRLSSVPEVQFHLGMAHYMLGQEAPALLALRRAVQSDQDFKGKDEAKRRVALLEIEVKNASPALTKEIETKVAADPNDPILLNRLASIYEQQNATNKIRAIYEKVLQQNPKNSQAMIKLAQSYASENPARALELARTARSLSPEDPQISFVLGHLLLQAHDYPHALDLLQEAAGRLPQTADLEYDLAWSQYLVGRIEEAKTSMNAALQSGPAFKNAEDAGRFLALVEAPDRNLAEKAAAEALKQDPNYIPALMISASMHEKNGSFAEAMKIYNNILGRDAFFAPASRAAAMLYAGNYPEDPKAYDASSRAREAYPADPDVAKALGIIMYHRATYGRAAQLLKESLEKNSNDPEILYYLGMTQFHLKQPSESKKNLQQALALNISQKRADEARRVLAQLK
jgi:tetratricopeptide (TPR) repeat protein